MRPDNGVVILGKRADRRMREPCATCSGGVREIQLTAAWDGPRYWIKFHEFLPKEPELLKRKYLSWSQRQGGAPPYPTSPRLLPDAFLRGLPNIDLFKVIQ